MVKKCQLIKSFNGRDDLFEAKDLLIDLNLKFDYLTYLFTSYVKK